jgi:hypothetical protein
LIKLSPLDLNLPVIYFSDADQNQEISDVYIEENYYCEEFSYNSKKGKVIKLL